jgi:hypothetical protein
MNTLVLFWGPVPMTNALETRPVIVDPDGELATLLKDALTHPVGEASLLPILEKLVEEIEKTSRGSSTLARYRETVGRMGGPGELTVTIPDFAYTMQSD